MRALNTYYNGHLFRSRLEARWAVFFDACGVKWEYEAQGYDLGEGVYYLPDFILHDVVFNHAGYSRGNDLYVEVKGQMTQEDAIKIKKFAKEKPILVVGEIPLGDTGWAIFESIDHANKTDLFDVAEFNFETVDDDYFTATPGIDLDGDFNLFGADSSYMNAMDEKLTVRAYQMARCARFDRGDFIIKQLKKN